MAALAWLALVFVIAVVAPAQSVRAQKDASSAAARSYEEVFAEALALERAHSYERAAQTLETIAAQYPDDYPLQLQLGYEWYLAGRYAAALPYYQRALALSMGSVDANLGMGYTLSGLARCPQAIPHFEAVLAKAKDHALASEGMRLCKMAAEPVVSLAVAPVAHVYQGHPYLKGAAGITVGGRARIAGPLSLAATYRHTQFILARAARSRGERFAPQHELHVRTDVAFERFGVSLSYGYVRAPSAPLDWVHVAGAVLRYSPWGHITLEGSASIYADQVVPRISPAWAIPLGDHVFVKPGAALQPTKDKFYWAPELLVSAHFDSASLFVSGRMGESFRPVWLLQPAIYNTLDILAEGASGGVSLALSSDLWFDAAYEMQRRKVTVENDAGSSERAAYAHLFVIGLHLTH